MPITRLLLSNAIIRLLPIVEGAPLVVVVVVSPIDAPPSIFFCQLCRTNGHYATECPKLVTFAQQSFTSDANLAQSFQA